MRNRQLQEEITRLHVHVTQVGKGEMTTDDQQLPLAQINMENIIQGQYTQLQEAVRHMNASPFTKLI